MTDIVARLHEFGRTAASIVTGDRITAEEAADAITALRAEIAAKDKEIARLREAIEEISALNVVVEGNAGPVVCSREIDAIVHAALATGARERSEDKTDERLGAVDTPAITLAGARPGAGDIPAPITKT